MAIWCRCSNCHLLEAFFILLLLCIIVKDSDILSIICAHKPHCENIGKLSIPVSRTCRKLFDVSCDLVQYVSSPLNCLFIGMSYSSQ